MFSPPHRHLAGDAGGGAGGGGRPSPSPHCVPRAPGEAGQVRQARRVGRDDVGLTCFPPRQRPLLLGGRDPGGESAPEGWREQWAAPPVTQDSPREEGDREGRGGEGRRSWTQAPGEGGQAPGTHRRPLSCCGGHRPQTSRACSLWLGGAERPPAWWAADTPQSWRVTGTMAPAACPRPPRGGQSCQWWRGRWWPPPGPPGGPRGRHKDRLTPEWQGSSGLQAHLRVGGCPVSGTWSRPGGQEGVGGLGRRGPQRRPPSGQPTCATCWPGAAGCSPRSPPGPGGLA